MKSRAALIKEKEKELEHLHYIMDMINEIPVDGKTLVELVYKWPGSTEPPFRVIARVKGFNSHSLVCEVLAQEIKNYSIRHVTRDPRYIGHYTPKTPYVGYKFKVIRTWKVFDVSQAPLTIRYEFLSEEYKQLMNWTKPGTPEIYPECVAQ